MIQKAIKMIINYYGAIIHNTKKSNALKNIKFPERQMTL